MREFMLIIHLIGLTLGIGTSFAYMFLGMAASKMEKEEAVKFTLNTFVISRMGHIGITLLILSGIYLIIPYWAELSNYPLLIVKLILVLVLVVLISLLSIYAREAKIGDTDKYMTKIRLLGPFSLITGLTIIVLAVFSFH